MYNNILQYTCTNSILNQVQYTGLCYKYNNILDQFTDNILIDAIFYI